MGDFVKPESVRLPLGDGQHIDIKRRLNHGETEDMYAKWSPLSTPGEPPQLQRRELRTAKVLAYLLGWSLTDDGQPVPMSPRLSYEERTATIENLDPDRFTELYEAILTHETTEQAARDALKKTTAGGSPAASTSPSPSGLAGVSMPSVP